MKWILIGQLLGSFIHSEHDAREACEGRAVLLREVKAVVKCVEAPTQSGLVYHSTGSGTWIGPAR